MIKKSLLIFLALVAVSFHDVVLGQGSLTPPGAPAPTMKSLSQIEPRTPISALPFYITQPGSYYVTTNLAANAGISIQTSNVNLDLGGFTLTATGTYQSGVIIYGNVANIVVRNGTLVGWLRGVDGYNSGTPRNVLYESLNVSSNWSQGITADADCTIRDCRAYGNGYSYSPSEGISSHGGQVIDCVARGNYGAGIFAYNCQIRGCHSEYNNQGGYSCNASTLWDCTAANNTGVGIQLYGGSSARRCHSQGNTSTGIATVNNAPILGGVIADCSIITNNYGINLGGGSYMVTGNEVAYNNSAAIIVQSSHSRIDGNHVLVAPSAYGIQLTSLSYSNNVIVRNSVDGGSSAGVNFNITGNVNDVGPIGNASTNTSPWANISH